jgi:tRNA(Ile)-lysidine synthase
MKDLVEVFASKIEEIFSQKKLPKKIAVAVSGGADSLALTLLLAEFCKIKKIKVFAITIDHKMRKNSSKEALKLNKFLSGKKISHQVLAIPTKKIPQKNIEAKLREARYQMLGDFCLKNKIEYLFLGHHLGDVAENFLIRLFRGSGLDGLSTMAEISEINKIKLVRPLLNFEKSQLEDFLKSKKVKYFEDETNRDEKFLRNKIRKFFESFPEKNLIQKRIKNTADEISKMRDNFDEEMLHAAAEILEFSENGYFLLDRKKFQKIDEKIALKILALVLMEVSGEIYKPRLEKLKNCYNYLMSNGEIKPRNFYGCVTKKWDENRAVIFCEGKNLAEKNIVNFSTILKKIFTQSA